MRSFHLRDVMRQGYDITIPERTQCVRQSDNQLFRLIRIITQDESTYNPYVIFVDCGGVSDPADAMEHLCFNGLMLNGVQYVLSERSASMTRVGVLSLVDSRIAEELDRHISMDIPPAPQVLSKYYAYRGLMFSSCHCLDGWRPKMIVVPDCDVVVPQQRIKYICDASTTITKEDGTEFEWKQKDIAEDVRDITINAFDGCGIHHPEITRQMTEMVGSKYPMTSVILRAPYIKGCSHELDYEKFLSERGVEYIKDVWGRWHSIHEPMFILTESMYKGYKYFKETGDANDWDRYWERFEKYNHCLGIAKWNFSFEDEPVYTRANYQILQDLDLTYDKFRHLADDSIEWISNIIDGDPLYTYCFLGLMADRCKPLNAYTKAIAKNPQMLHEPSVRNYLISLVQKYMDEMKCGKLWLRACFKFLAPDLIMLMEHIGGLPLVGSLEADEFYASGDYEGEHLIERNPHICRSEHTPLNGKKSDLLQEYCSHLANVCIINCKSITPQRLNGADFDGDLVLVTNNEIMRQGVDHDVAIVIDVDDKITVTPEWDTPENRLQCMLRTLKSFIGEYSNYSSAYHNKCPRTEEQKQKYAKYVDIISTLTGKSIDYAKTGVIYHMPRHIAKYGRPLPWFMRYRSNYYKKQDLSRAPSNMNRLCWDIEKWERGIRWQRTFRDFDYKIMVDPDLAWDQQTYDQIEELFLAYTKESQTLSNEQSRVRKYADDDIRFALTRFDAENFVIDWGSHYESYKQRCREICPNQKLLANIVVDLCYVKYPKKPKRFMWVVAEDGILDNLQQDFVMMLPKRDLNGDCEYLGRRYKMAFQNDDEEIIEWDDMMSETWDMFD